MNSLPSSSRARTALQPVVLRGKVHGEARVLRDYELLRLSRRHPVAGI